MTLRAWSRLFAATACICSACAFACSSEGGPECRDDPAILFVADRPTPQGPCTVSVRNTKTMTLRFMCDPCEAGVARDLDCVDEDPSGPTLTCEWVGTQLHAHAEGDAARAVFDYVGSTELTGQFDCDNVGSIPTFGYASEQFCAL